MKQKEMKMVAYVAPDVSIYEIHPEGALCGSPYGDANAAGYTLTEDPDYEYDM